MTVEKGRIDFFVFVYRSLSLFIPITCEGLSWLGVHFRPDADEHRRIGRGVIIPCVYLNSLRTRAKTDGLHLTIVNKTPSAQE